MSESKCVMIGMLGGKWEKYLDSDRRVYSDEGISPTIRTVTGGGKELKIYTHARVRKMTPRECWRLMGFTDKDYDKAASVNKSKTVLYKQAGNSIVVPVLEEIFKAAS